MWEREGLYIFNSLSSKAGHRAERKAVGIILQSEAAELDAIPMAFILPAGQHASLVLSSPLMGLKGRGVENGAQPPPPPSPNSLSSRASGAGIFTTEPPEGGGVQPPAFSSQSYWGGGAGAGGWVGNLRGHCPVPLYISICFSTSHQLLVGLVTALDGPHSPLGLYV